MKDAKAGKIAAQLPKHVGPSSKTPRAGTAASSSRSESDWRKQLAEERVNKGKKDAQGSHPVGATSSANSITADPFARKKALSEPVPQVTRHI